MRLLGAPVAYIRYLHLQLFLKYSPKGSGDALASRVGKLRDAYCRDLARAMFAVGLADNGSEFSRADDVTLILFGEGGGMSRRPAVLLRSGKPWVEGAL